MLERISDGMVIGAQRESMYVPEKREGGVIGYFVAKLPNGKNPPVRDGLFEVVRSAESFEVTWTSHSFVNIPDWARHAILQHVPRREIDWSDRDPDKSISAFLRADQAWPSTK